MDTNTSPKIFLVDDEPYCLCLYEQYVRNLGYKDVHLFGKSVDCLNQLTLQPDVVFLDYNMDNLNGIDILKKIKRFDPNIMVFFVSGQEAINIAVNALKYGAFDYIIKQDISEAQMKGCMDKVEKVKELLAKRKNQGLIKKLLSAVGISSVIYFLQKLLSKT